MSHRRALVTGAAGFVGACLTRRLLADGHRVELLLRAESDRWRLEDIARDTTIHEGDLRDTVMVRKAVNAAKPDWVFHCAAHGAYSWQGDVHGIFESNVLGTLNLAEACISQGFEAFVQAGSSSEYGLKDHAPTEGELPEPNSDYAVAKTAATMLCRSLAERHGLRMVTLRLYSVYGPWEDPRRLIPALVVHGLRGELPLLVSPDTARDFVHVEDVCEAFLLAASERAPDTNNIYNVGSGWQTTLREVVETARAVLDISALPQWGTHQQRMWDTNVWIANPEKIEQQLEWSPKHNLEAGISEIAAWLTGNPRLRKLYEGAISDG